MSEAPTATTTTSPQGTLDWDTSKPHLTSTSLLAQMAFPLVSIVLARDQFDAKDAWQVKPMLAAYPMLGVGENCWRRRIRGRKGVGGRGGEGIQIGSASDAVSWVWENPEATTRSLVLEEFRTFGGWGQRRGKGRNPFGERRGTVRRIWVELN